MVKTILDKYNFIHKIWKYVSSLYTVDIISPCGRVVHILEWLLGKGKWVLFHD